MKSISAKSIKNRLLTKRKTITYTTDAKAIRNALVLQKIFPGRIWIQKSKIFPTSQIITVNNITEDIVYISSILLRGKNEK